MHLQDFSSQSWDLLQDRLIQAYAEAYRIDFSPQMTNLKKKLQDLLKKLKDQETRFKLKALVHQLDIETQFL
jgi:thiosulfate reductase cytochrome b subunit